MKKKRFNYSNSSKLLGLLVFCAIFCFKMAAQSEMYGVVLDQQKQPLPGANVVLLNTSTGFKAGAQTDFDGKYLIRDLQLGGPYKVTVSYVGFQTIIKEGLSFNLGDRIKENFTLLEGQELKNVVIKSQRGSFKSKSRLGTAVSITGKTLEKIPTTTRNYEDLSNLSPLSTPKMDLGSGSPFGGLSVAGANGGGTGITLDGANNRRSVFGGTSDGPAFTISMEAIKEFEIITNEYRVSGPRSAGGSIKAVTKRGGNKWQGAAWGYGSGGAFSGDKNFVDNKQKVDFQNNQFGFRVSGPIIKDKLSFIAVFDRFYQENPLGSGDNAKGFVNFKSGVKYPFTEGEIKRYVDKLANLGVIPDNNITKQTGEQLKEKTTKNYFLRLDWNINDNNNLSLSYNHLDFYDSFQAGVGGGAKITFFSTGYPYSDANKKLTAILKTRTAKGSNKLQFSYGNVKRDNLLANDAIRAPRIIVDKVNGKTDASVGAGLATWVPEQIYNNNFQLIDVLTHKIGNVVYTFGTDILVFKADENIPHFIAGDFAYNTLSDFENGQPRFFQKKFKLDPNDDERMQYTSYEGALFAQMEYDITDHLKMEAGLRYDMAVFLPRKDPTNSKLAAIQYKGKNLTNNSRLKDFNNIQPRINFTWDKKGEGKEIIKLGMGLFSSQITTQPYTFSLGISGTRFLTASTTNTEHLKQIHNAYTQGEKAKGKSGFSGDVHKFTIDDYARITGINKNDIAPDVIVLDPDFDMPMTFKMSASYHRFVNDWLRLGTSVYYNNTRNVPFYENINLKENGQNPLDGRMKYLKGKNKQFGNVHVFKNSNWSATFGALTLEAYFRLPKGGNVNFSYTKSYSKGYSYYNAGGDIEAGKPLTYSYDSYTTNAEGWQDNNSIPNKIVLSFLTPEIKGFSLSGALILGQFGRFSAFANANAMGAGIGANNLAYIPTESEVSSKTLKDKDGNDYKPYADFNQMLSRTSPEFRDYIQNNRGGYANFNGGVQPWSYTTNMSLIKNLKIYKQHRAIFRMDIFNVLNMFSNQLGGYKFVSNTNLIKYDAAKYKYTINKDAGIYSQGGDLFRLQFGLKYEF